MTLLSLLLFFWFHLAVEFCTPEINKAQRKLYELPFVYG